MLFVLEMLSYEVLVVIMDRMEEVFCSCLEIFIFNNKKGGRRFLPFGHFMPAFFLQQLKKKIKKNFFLMIIEYEVLVSRF